MQSPFERVALLFELNECERRIDQLRVRLGQQPHPDGYLAEYMRIDTDQQTRAEERLDALQNRSQDLLEQLWPIRWPASH